MAPMAEVSSITPRAWKNHQACHAAVYPLMAAMFREGLGRDETARRLNEMPLPHSVNSRVKPWKGNMVRRVIIDNMDPDEYARLVAAKWSGNASKMHATKRDHNHAVIPRMVELRKSGLACTAVADQLNEDGFVNSLERPWTGRGVSQAIQSYADPAEIECVPKGAAIRYKPNREFKPGARARGGGMVEGGPLAGQHHEAAQQGQADQHRG